MFHGWGYMLSEIWLLLAISAVIGLVIGWFVWGEGQRIRARPLGLRG
jgi:hypothetical protein